MAPVYGLDDAPLRWNQAIVFLLCGPWIRSRLVGTMLPVGEKKLEPERFKAWF